MARNLEVVVFTYNHEAFVEQALKSILSQKAPFEISLRIHDDASTDGTVGIIKGLLSSSSVPWELTQAPENRYSQGISFFHEFMAESKSEFIAMLDGDDFWIDDHKLRIQVDALDRFPRASLCHHPVLEHVSGEFNPIPWPPAEYRREVLPGSMLALQNPISTSSVVLRGSMFPREMPGGFNRLRIGDYPLWSLATDGREVAFVDRVMSAYRVHGSNIWASLQPEDRFDQELEARIYISNIVAEESRTRWRMGIVNAMKHRFDSTEKLSQLDGKLHEAEIKLDIQATELEAARRETQHLLASTSWAITKPLRAIVSSFKRLRKP